jgi:hypothetical protein
MPKANSSDRPPIKCAICGKVVPHDYSKGGRPPKYCQDTLDCKAKGLVQAIERQRQRRIDAKLAKDSTDNLQ